MTLKENVVEKLCNRKNSNTFWFFAYLFVPLHA